MNSEIWFTKEKLIQKFYLNATSSKYRFEQLDLSLRKE